MVSKFQNSKFQNQGQGGKEFIKQARENDLAQMRVGSVVRMVGMLQVLRRDAGEENQEAGAEVCKIGL